MILSTIKLWQIHPLRQQKGNIPEGHDRFMASMMVHRRPIRGQAAPFIDARQEKMIYAG